MSNFFKLENFKNKLLRLLQDQSRQQELSQNCALYAQKYSWEEVTQETLKVYKSAL